MAKKLGAEQSGIESAIVDGARLSNVTPETFLDAVREISAINAKVAALNETRKAIRKKHKANGIELGHMDAIMKMADWDRTEVVEAFRLRREYALMLGLPIEAQGDMFADAPDAEVSRAEWFNRGLVAYRLGRPAEVPDDCPPDYAEAFMDGYDSDEDKAADHAEQNAAAAKIDPAAKGNVAQIGDALKKRAAKKPTASKAPPEGEAV